MVCYCSQSSCPFQILFIEWLVYGKSKTSQEVACKAGSFSDENASKTHEQPAAILNARTLEKLGRGKNKHSKWRLVVHDRCFGSISVAKTAFKMAAGHSWSLFWKHFRRLNHLLCRLLKKRLYSFMLFNIKISEWSLPN